MPKKLMINISGRYIDPDAICLAHQEGNEIVIHLQGMEETVRVGTEYWAKLCAKFFEVQEV